MNIENIMSLKKEHEKQVLKKMKEELAILFSEKYWMKDNNKIVRKEIAEDISKIMSHKFIDITTDEEILVGIVSLKGMHLNEKVQIKFEPKK